MNKRLLVLLTCVIYSSALNVPKLSVLILAFLCAYW